ncbi:helix-turn-helix domain-containing protein [Caballeronia sp. 15715]|uniref:helix-turn-helix domain-containing protein n=1 Tax=unclassified Caballeronia TaxID=2646786 RepID=UPI0039E285CC
MRFDLTDLRLFAAVAACGNLTKAAESLPIAVAAASSRIKSLEESVDARCWCAAAAASSSRLLAKSF